MSDFSHEPERFRGWKPGRSRLRRRWWRWLPSASSRTCIG